MTQIFSSMGAETINDAAFLSRVNALAGRAVTPFSDQAIDVLEALSKPLLQRRDAPHVAALGYWLRPAALKRQKVAFNDALPDYQFPIPRGLAFHLPPTNVDTLFAYSWALSLLAGNSNIVRLPSKRTALTDWLIRTLLAVLEKVGEADRHIFCSYDHGSGLNAKISALADLRMIWGGDLKVLEVSVDPVRPDGLSLGFPDRKSLAAIHGPAYGALDDEGRNSLAERFFNDVYWFDQMGCGSPRVVVWVGESNVLPRDFYTRVTAITARKGYSVETGIAISKFAFMNDRLAEGNAVVGYRVDNALDILELDRASPPLKVIGGGLLSEIRLGRLEEAALLIDRSTQTVTHFGFDKTALTGLAREMSGRGGFRVVPVGQALNFDVTWDGIDLLSHMTRRIVVTP